MHQKEICGQEIIGRFSHSDISLQMKNRILYSNITIKNSKEKQTNLEKK